MTQLSHPLALALSAALLSAVAPASAHEPPAAHDDHHDEAVELDAVVVQSTRSGRRVSDEPSAQLNVMPTAHPFWRRGKTMDASDLSRSGLTYAVLTADRGEELLTWFPEDFLARTSALREKELALKVSGLASGRSSLASFAKYDQVTSGWKTAHSSLLGDSESFSGIWPKWGSMRNGECSEANALDFPMNARECGFSLPTPSGVNGGRNHTMGRIDEWGAAATLFVGPPLARSAAQSSRKW